MQIAVQDEFGLVDAAIDHMEMVIDSRGEEQTELGRRVRDIYKMDRAYSRIEYENTQAWFKERGIAEVTVYRGMAVPEGSLELGKSTTVAMQPASSWSTDLETARSFMRSREKQDPVLLRARIPASRILSTAVTGRGCLKEAEVLVLGGKLNVQVGKYDLQETRFRWPGE
jgi:hypothetical protein